MQVHRPLTPALFSVLLLAAACGDSSESTPATGSTASARPSPPAAAPSMTADQYFRLGQRMSERGQTEKAVEQYRRALELEAGHVEARFALGKALVPLSSAKELGSSTRDLGILDEALGHLEAVAAAHPDDAGYAYWFGRALDLRGRDADAAASLRRAIELDPEHGGAHKRLGLVLIESGEMEAARASFEASLALLPEDAGARFQLGNLMLEEDPERAREYYEEAIAIDPTFPYAYHGLSQALAQLGDVEGAEAAREKLEIYQSYELTLRNKLAKAADAPTDANAQFDAGQMFHLLGKEEEALRMFERSLELDPGNGSAHYYCGLIMSSWELWERAMNHLEEALYLSPDDLGARVELIRVCTLMGNTERADELAAGLADLVREEDPATRKAVAEVLLETSAREEGLELLRGVLEAAPEDEVAKLLLERATQ